MILKEENLLWKKDILWVIVSTGWRNDDIPEICAENMLQHLLSDIEVAGFQGTEAFFLEATILNKEFKLRNLRITGQRFSSFIIRDRFKGVSQAFHKYCTYFQKVNADVAIVFEQIYSV